MPVRMRATFFFEDSNKHGWSETIYSLKPDIATTLKAAVDLIPSRRALLGDTASLVFARVSDDLIKRDSLIYQVPPGDQNLRSASAAAADIANTCLVVRLESTPLIRRTLYMRGVPDSIVVNSGRYSPSAGFQIAFDRWMTQLKQDAWACRSKNDIVQSTSITNVVQDPVTGRVTVTTALPHTFLLTTPVTIKQVRGATQVNGSWSLYSVPTDSTFVISLNRLITPYAGGGLAQIIGYTLSAITEGEVRRVSHRNAGRPFDSPRGRRSARARR